MYTQRWNGHVSRSISQSKICLEYQTKNTSYPWQDNTLQQLRVHTTENKNAGHTLDSISTQVYTYKYVGVPEVSMKTTFSLSQYNKSLYKQFEQLVKCTSI